VRARSHTTREDERDAGDRARRRACHRKEARPRVTPTPTCRPTACERQALSRARFAGAQAQEKMTSSGTDQRAGRRSTHVEHVHSAPLSAQHNLGRSGGTSQWDPPPQPVQADPFEGGSRTHARHPRGTARGPCGPRWTAGGPGGPRRTAERPRGPHRTAEGPRGPRRTPEGQRDLRRRAERPRGGP